MNRMEIDQGEGRISTETGLLSSVFIECIKIEMSS